LFLDEPSVTELLLRRSPPLPFFLTAFFDLEDAFLLQAASTANVTLCWACLVRGSGCRSSGTVQDARFGDEDVDERPNTCVLEENNRVWAPCVDNACDQLLMVNRGRGTFCVSGWSTTERRRIAPTVQPTFLLIIFTAATWWTHASPRMCEGGGMGGTRRVVRR
jgi:hypothetical protein